MCDLCGLDENSFFEQLFKNIKEKISFILGENIEIVALIIPPRLRKPSGQEILEATASMVIYLLKQKHEISADTDEIIEEKMTPEYVADLLVQTTAELVKNVSGDSKDYLPIFFSVLNSILNLFLERLSGKPPPVDKNDIENIINLAGEINKLPI
ncbi:hypothetical protein KKB69_02330 [Patescibacteria group bacterium]|nr:hypothetical protein [Patescibacteria group bacterium]